MKLNNDLPKVILIKNVFDLLLVLVASTSSVYKLVALVSVLVVEPQLHIT